MYSTTYPPLLTTPNNINKPLNATSCAIKELTKGNCCLTMLLIFVSGRPILPMTAKNTRNLQTSAERLVEEHTSLEFWNKWKPGKECNGSEEKQTHDDLVATSECPYRSPESSSLDKWFQCLCNLEIKDGWDVDILG